MDCLKVINTWECPSKIGVFHSFKDYSDGYSGLYAAISTNSSNKFKILTKLSDRGSQGTIFSH